MKRAFFVKLLLGVIMMLSAAGSALALETYNLNFTLYNESGYTFGQVWLRPSHLNERWTRANIRPLRSGYHIRVTADNCSALRRKNYLRYWDVRVYTGGTPHEWTGIRLSAITQLWIDDDFYASWD